MIRVPAEWVRRGAALCCLAAFLCLDPGSARAGVTGSKHDFSAITGTSLTPGGACSACHIAHYGQTGNLIWARSLTEENAYFDQRLDPNYAPGFTVLCYDCHDNHAIVGGVDNDPPDASFDSSRLPQDAAFDNDMGTTIPRDGADDDDKPGYYENIPSDTVGYPVTGGSASTYISGHYVKNPPGVGGINQGDKLPCSDCHDPHSTVNQAFIRGDLGGKTLSGVRASTRMAYDTTDRNDDDSRDICIACHGTSEQATYQAVAFSAVNPSYGGNTIAAPPTSISAHLSTKTIACTGCHKHNGISASCTDCHGFPPLLTQAEAGGLFVMNDPVRKYAENYAGGAGAHRRHKEALGDTIFQCELCHGPDPGSAAWHNQGGGSIPNGDDVNIMGLRAYWDPDNSRTTDYVGTSNAPPATPITPDPYEFSKTGGGDQRCSGLACHGDPPNTVGALNWTDKMVDDTTGAAVNIEVCKWCHDATPARIGAAGIVAPNVLGDGLTWGADVSGHGLASGQYDADSVGGGGGRPAANKQCAVCHDATYTTNAAPAVNTPTKPHFNATSKRLRDTLNNQSIGGDPDASCLACHQVSGEPDSPQHYLSLVTSHGNSNADGYLPIEGSPFSRSCRQCHEVHGSNWNGVGGVPRNLHMLGKWVDANGDGQPTGVALGAEAARVDSDATSNVANINGSDLPVIVTSSGGTVADDSWNDGVNDGVAESICVVCHVSLEKNHSQRGDTYLQGQGHNVGRECQLCHQHGDLSTRPNKADDAFGPLSCFACHGTPPGTVGVPAGQLEGQFWPDSRPSLEPLYSYANDEPGAHRAHIEFIALKVFGETLAQLVMSGTTQNPGIQSFTKQVEVCKFCHYDPGGTDAIPDAEAHYVNSATLNSPVGRVNVKQGTETLETPPNASPYFRKFTTGSGPWGGGMNFADDTTGGAYDFATDSCANLVCHNQSPTPPAAGTGNSPGWNTPPDWTAGIDANCSNTSCHAPATQIDLPDPEASGYHGTHAGPAGRGYDCIECHRNNYNAADLTASLRHQNALVDMNGSPGFVWNGAGSIEGTTGGADGFYDKDGTGAASVGDTGFDYKNGIYGNTCYDVYCHGADNTAADPPNWGGGTTAPIWNDTATVYCGSCHDANGTGGAAPGGTDVVATGNHTDHLTAAYGPNPGAAAGCAAGATTGCHPSYTVTSASHADATVNFLNLDGTTVADFAGTDTCDTCHGASATSARANWASGSYVLPCIECHDATTPASSARTGTTGGGIDAPAKSALWGTRGHGLDTGSQYDQTAYGDAAGNSGAGAVCGNCHDGTGAHISGTPGDTDRLTSGGNGLCFGCHDGAGAGSATTQVSTHGNRSTTMSDEYTAQRAAFELNCVECHDVHGTTNIYMINPVNADGPLVSTVGWPRYYNGAEATTPLLFQGAPVAFTANGAGSNYASTAATPDPNKICQTCHTATGDGDTSGPVYQHDSATTAHGISKCTACHNHDIDQDYSATSQDGFMPLDCDRCHDAAASNPPPAAAQAPKIMANWATSGHGKSGIVAECGDCHDIGSPSSPITHLDGTVNSVWENGTVTTRNTNTAHLRGEYFTPVTSVGTGAWDVQVTVDNRCWKQCHETAGALNHRHEVDTAAGANNHWSVEFNTHLTYADGDRGSGIWEPADWVTSPSSDPANAPYPIDCDLTSNADCSGTNYAPCISCHDPHGTSVVETGEFSNFMLRRKWKGTGTGSYLCRGCHL